MMNPQPARSRIVSRILLLSALALGGVSVAWSAPHAPMHEGKQACRARMMAHMQMRQKDKLDRMANRLEIRASQQPVWQAYVDARTAMFGNMQPRPQQTDAVTMAQFRAARAAAFAQNLAAISDATAKLSAALDPNQRSLFDQMAREQGASRRPESR